MFRDVLLQIGRKCNHALVCFCCGWQVVSSVKEYQSWTVIKAVKNRFYLGTVAIGGKRLLYRTGLYSEYNREKWVFIVGGGAGVILAKLT